MEGKRKEISLAEFIKENVALLTALGIFTALTGYASSIPTFGPYLSFLFLSISILIWLQLWALFPEKENETRLLSLFEIALTLVVFITIFYWILYCKQVWNQMLFVLIFGILLAIITYPINKYGVYNKIFKIRNKTTKALFYSLTLLICIVLALLIYRQLNNILDILMKEMK